GLADDIDAEEFDGFPAAPGMVADEAFAFAGAASGGHEEDPGDFGGGVGEDAGGIGDADAAGGAGGGVDVVVADAVVGDGLDVGAGVEEGAVDFVGEHGDDAVGVLGGFDKLFTGEGVEVGGDGDFVAGGAEDGGAGFWEWAGDEDAHDTLRKSGKSE